MNSIKKNEEVESHRGGNKEIKGSARAQRNHDLSVALKAESAIYGPVLYEYLALVSQCQFASLNKRENIDENDQKTLKANASNSEQ